MALFGLFGKKDEDPQPKDAFFLEDEVAKSMGDTSYMKASKSIRRTYPKGGGGEYFEEVKTVSSSKSSINDSRKNGLPKQAESTSSYSAPATSFSSASSFGSSSSSFGSSSSSFGSSSYSAPAPTPAPEPTFAAPETTTPSVSPSVSNEASQARRKSDSGMDMFRNMAKDIRK
jgi:hypothetical protein